MEHKRITRLPEETQKNAKSKYSELVDINKNTNLGLHNASGAFVKYILGKPMSDNVKLITHAVSFGPFKDVDGLDPAINSLIEVMTVVNEKYRDLYNRLSHDGMLVVRPISGSTSPSLHSWGIAIDIKIDGIKDVRFNDKALYGLTLMAPIFNMHGWFWGGAFRDKETKKGSGVYWSNEDAMHFEISKEKLLEWQRTGMLGPISKSRRETVTPADSKLANTNSTSHDHSKFDFLCKGDHGPKVVVLQNALKARNYNITADGSFGKNTETALIDFQRKHGITSNGTVGFKTALYLALS